MTKLVVCSDAHADWVTYGVPRHAEVEAAFYDVAGAAMTSDVDALVFAGDLTDPEDGLASTRALSAMLGAFRAPECPKYVIPGNHDVFEDGSGDSALTPLRHLDKQGFRLHESPQFVPAACEGKFDLLSLPYAPLARAYDPGEFVRKVRERQANRLKNGAKRLPLVVVGHLSIPGVVPGEETTEMPRGREVTFPLDEVAALEPTVVLNGHYHERQVFTAPNGLKIHIPGSMARLTIDQEDHAPGYLVVEF